MKLKKMKPKEYNEALEKIGLNQLAAGRVFGLSPRQAQRFALGESPITRPVAKLVKLILKRKVTVEQVTHADDDT
jgi:energy-coupling factor transporter ATP-binding protein EcfA2